MFFPKWNPAATHITFGLGEEAAVEERWWRVYKDTWKAKLLGSWSLLGRWETGHLHGGVSEGWDRCYGNTAEAMAVICICAGWSSAPSCLSWFSERTCSPEICCRGTSCVLLGPCRGAWPCAAAPWGLLELLTQHLRGFCITMLWEQSPLTEGSLEMKHLFFDWFVWKRARRVEKGFVCVWGTANRVKALVVSWNLVV